MQPMCSQITSKCRAAAGSSRLLLHLAGLKAEGPSMSTLLPMLIGSIVIVVIGVIVGLIVG